MSAAVQNVTGMCQFTGCMISGVDHVRQSVSRIIHTAIGTSITLRDFGTNIMALIDAPGNDATRVKAITILAKALLTWEPRIKLSHIVFNVNFDGRAVIEIHYSYNGQNIAQNTALDNRLNRGVLS